MPPAPRAMGPVGGAGGTRVWGGWAPGRRALVAGLGRAPVVRPLGGITERRAGPGAHVTWEGSAPLGLITHPPFCRDSQGLFLLSVRVNPTRYAQAEEVHQLHRQDLPIEPNHPPTCLRARAVSLAVSGRGADLPRPSADVPSKSISSVTSFSLPRSSRTSSLTAPTSVPFVRGSKMSW